MNGYHRDHRAAIFSTNFLGSKNQSNADLRKEEMHTLGIIVAAIGIGLVISLNVAHILRYGRFLRYLKSNHSDHWKSVGSPEQFDDDPQFGEVGFSAYLANRRYAELGDPQLSMLGDKMLGMRKSMFIGIVIFGIGCGIAGW